MYRSHHLAKFFDVYYIFIQKNFFITIIRDKMSYLAIFSHILSIFLTFSFKFIAKKVIMKQNFLTFTTFLFKKIFLC